MTEHDPGKRGDKAVGRAGMRNGNHAPAPRAARLEDRPFAVGRTAVDQGAPRVEAPRREERRRVAFAQRVVDLTAEASTRLGDFILILVAWAVGGGFALYF